MCTLANSEHPNEMLHNAFHQDLHYLLRQKQSSEKELHLGGGGGGGGGGIKSVTPQYIQWTIKSLFIKPEGRIHLCIQGKLYLPWHVLFLLIVL